MTNMKIKPSSFKLKQFKVFIAIFVLIVGFQNCSVSDEAQVSPPAQGSSKAPPRTIITPPKASAYAKLEENPFGVGAHHVGFDAIDQSQRSIFRMNHFANAKNLIGSGGYIRIWCHVRTIWTKPYESGPAECAKSVQLAHDMNMVPVIVIQEVPDHDPGQILDPNVGYKNYQVFSNAVKELVKGLPRPANRIVWIEMANEPNFTDWWVSYTCSWKVRAWEVARQTVQTIDAVRSLNDPNIKILGPSLSPYGDFDFAPTTQTTCKSRGTLGLSSVDFLKEMKKAEPSLFSPSPKFDAWNSHSYPDNIFNLCDANITNSCKPFDQQHGIISYRAELQAAGLSADFPIFLTEVSLFNRSAQGVDNAAFLRNKMWYGVYTDIWLARKPYNNVRAVMTYVLTTTYDSEFDLMPSSAANAPVQQLSQQSQIFQRLYQLRSTTIMAGKLPEGRYRRFDGMLLYADGHGNICDYKSMQSFYNNGGSTNLDNVKAIYQIPPENVIRGACQ